MASPAPGGTQAYQQAQLTLAVSLKISALGNANTCLSGLPGNPAPAQQQVQLNSNEIQDLQHALLRIKNNTFNWPGDPVVNATIAKSQNLLTSSHACVNPPGIIHDSAVLIGTMPGAAI